MRGRHILRRGLLVNNLEMLALLAVGAASAFGFYQSGREQISYEDAQKDRRLRQRYSNEIRKKYPIDGLDAVVYRDDVKYFNPLLQKPMVMRTVTTILPGSTVRSATIEGYDSAFEFLNEDEFLSQFVDHEYVHVRILTGGIGLAADSVEDELVKRVFDGHGDLFETFQELEAYSNQIKKFHIRSNISKIFMNEVVDSYTSYRRFLKNKELTPLVEWMLQRYPEFLLIP